MADLKMKAKTLVCERYVSIDSNGDLDYKKYLKYAINKKYVSKEDALAIVLDLMYSVNNYGLTYHDIEDELEKLVLKVKRCNENNQTFLKKSIFYNEYSKEKVILQEYIDDIQTQKPNSSHDNYSVNIKPSKNKLKQIKLNLNHLSKKELCYILDKDPELTFEKKKSLKNEIANEFNKYPVDANKLKDAPKESIKDYLNVLIEKDSENEPNELTLKIRHRMESDAKKRKKNAKIRMENNKSKSKKNLKHPKVTERKILTSENSVNNEDGTQKSGHIFEKIEMDDKDYIFREYEKVKDKISEDDFVKEIYRFKRENEDNPFLNDYYIVKKVVEEYKNKKVSPTRKEISAEDYKLFRKYKLKKRHEEFKNNISEEEFLEELKKLEIHGDDLNNFFKHINKGYLSHSIRKNLIGNFKDLYIWASKIYYYPNFKSHVTNQLNCLIKFIEYYEDLKEYSNLTDTSDVNQIKRINDSYVDDEIKRNESFFNDISDENKKRAVVCDEDNIKVVAGAGAGKTFIIQKKIDYLIQKFGNKKKILCLCYTGKGVNDLKEKIGNGNNIDIFTFHGFCREVSQKCGKYRPTDDKLLDDVINNYIRKVIDDDEKLGEILEYFNYYVKNPSEHNFDSMEEYEEFKRGNNIKTLRNKYDFYNGYQKQSYKGEVVRSLEELIIANFLFMHEIDYIYEDTYEHEYLSPIISHFLSSFNYFCLNRDLNNDLGNLKQFNEYEKSLESYQPDFYLPEKNVYIEHFGVARDNVAYWLRGDAQKKYTEDMYFKLDLHDLYNTKLITTFSYYMSEGILLDELRESLSDYFELHERDKKEIFNIIINNNRSEDFKHFKQLIKSFINIFEAKNLPKSKLDDFKKDNRSQKNVYLKRKHELFLNIVSEIYEDYELWNQVGGLYYNREVTAALSLIESAEFKESYDYIFIDEYQDINYVRCKLLQELQKINDSKLFVVGDDWQSIYGFNGSEVNLFVNFDEYFPNSETIKISENRRNCQALIDISSDFIRQNENQEEKELEYYKKDGPINHNPIRLVPYDKKENKILYVEKIIQEVIRSNTKKDLKILLLGRNNKDINFLINNRLFKQVYGDKKYKRIEYSKNSNITIDFMSIHQSKGLEKDEVIVLNFENYDYGFPNRVDDDSVLHFIKDQEDYPFAEERRLLYVALTRTRHNVYLLYPNIYYSDFIEELKNEYELKDSNYKINPKDLINLNEFNDFYCGNDYKYWYYNSIPIPIEDIDYYFKINDDGFLNEIELELYIWYENMLRYEDPLENAFKKLIGFNEGTKSNLKNKSLQKRNAIRNSDISVLVNGKKCNFTISGIGYKAVKFTKRIIFDNKTIKKEFIENILRKNSISIDDLDKLLGI